MTRMSDSHGFTMVELMIAMVIAIAVTLMTVSMSSSVFSANTEAVHMVQLTQQVRSAMQLISRDIRRAGYEDDVLSRFLSNQEVSSGVTMGPLDEQDSANCLQVEYEDLDGTAVNSVYRLRVVQTVGRIAANFDADATCATSILADGWVDITDPLLTDVDSLVFVRSEQLTDIAENQDTGNVIQVGVQQISILINASMRENAAIQRVIVNEVQLRNETLTV